MSLKTLPLLFINFGGEMVYILDQRLRAQSIAPDKAKKVLHDIIGTMFNRRFMDELFKPQELYSKRAMRTVFDRLAHASIMRLNSSSMDKLFDLMTMAFKYQVSLCLRPSDILLSTLNHIDAIRSFVSDSSSLQPQVEYVFRLLIQHFGSLSAGEFMLIRQTLLNYFQDLHIRVSIFLKEKVQTSTGRFIIIPKGPVPCGTEVPGTIRLFDSSGQQRKKIRFPVEGAYENSTREGSLSPNADRCTNLGTNMYGSARTTEMTVAGPSSPVKAQQRDAPPDPQANAQLDLLSKLIGNAAASNKSRSSTKPEFHLSLFESDDEDNGYEPVLRTSSTNCQSKVINIDASKRGGRSELNNIMGNLDLRNNDSEDEDLLELMDRSNK